MSSADLTGGVLKAVSRSFYLSIRVLPGPIRGPIGLAYLLARASDTIADSTNAPAQTRVRHLAALDRMIQRGDTAGLGELQRENRPEHGGEKELIARLGECLSALNSMTETDKGEIRRVLAEIIRGQTLDLERFSGEPGTLRALQSAAELEEYTYLVAGCVGGFWTRICQLHLADFAKVPRDELVRIGTDFGKGLQLVNILRDLPEDLRNGRCYLPREELAAAGLSPESLLEQPEDARAVFIRWLERGETLIDAGRQYVSAIRPARVRLACYLPWFIGKETLKLLRATPPLEASGRVKVPRSAVRTALLRGLVAAFSDAPLRSAS